MTQKVILVNRQDQEIGQEEKLLAHQKALCHRAFSVFVFRKSQYQLELLLQRRQFDKYHSGGLWTNTCCGHPKPGEKVIDAAKRRLKEEMGFSIALHHMCSFHYKASLDCDLVEHEIDHLFYGFFQDETIAPNKQEVAEFRWEEVESLKKDLDIHPHHYTAWFKEALSKVMLSIEI